MEPIAILKKQEAAWREGHITPTEYHQILNYGIWRLAQDELRGPCSFGQDREAL